MTDELLQLTRKAAEILKAAGAREVYVFGSAAKGTARQGSDLDLAVSGLPPRIFFQTMGKVHEAIGRPLDLIDLDENTLFVQYLREHGELLRVG